MRSVCACTCCTRNKRVFHIFCFDKPIIRAFTNLVGPVVRFGEML